MSTHALFTIICLCFLLACSKDPKPKEPRADIEQILDLRVLDAALPDLALAEVDLGVEAGSKPEAGLSAEAGFQIVARSFQFEAEAPKPKSKPKRRKRRKRSKTSKSAGSKKRRAPSAAGTIQKHWGEVEACYARVALKDPSIGGRIVLRWTLDRDGKPNTTQVIKDTLKDKSVSACIRARAQNWRFPPPEGGIGVITYPFNLRVQ